MADKYKESETPWRDEQKLRELRLDREFTKEEIAEKFDCSTTTVTKWINKHDIPSVRNRSRKDRPWEDRSTLTKLYNEDRRTYDEIANELDASSSTIKRWIDMHDIESRDRSQRYPELADREKLVYWHYDGEMSLSDIANKIGCTKSAVGKAFERHGIEVNQKVVAKKRRMNSRKTHPRFIRDHYGYEVITSKFDGEMNSVKHHRLIAVAEWGFDAVKGKVVHHKKNIPWLNYADNLEVMTRSEHSKHHTNASGGNS